MGRKAVFTDVEMTEARRMASEATGVCEFKHGLSVILSADLGLSNQQVATALQASLATVARMHGRVRRIASGNQALADGKSTWGGRRHAHMTPEEESEFLRPWEERAETDGGLVVSAIHEAYERRVGRRVQAATVYRLLDRHGWRKIVPDGIRSNECRNGRKAFDCRRSQRLWAKR